MPRPFCVSCPVPDYVCQLDVNSLGTATATFEPVGGQVAEADTQFTVRRPSFAAVFALDPAGTSAGIALTWKEGEGVAPCPSYTHFGPNDTLAEVLAKGRGVVVVVLGTVCGADSI